MRRLCFALLLIASCAAFASAQDEKKIACYVSPKTTESFKKKLWDGYEISLGPARNAAETDGGDCTAAIYNAAGKVVFRTTGFGVIFDEEHTGMDFDGDGKGEVVFITDEAGGAHCCWVYNVVTLVPKPQKLFDVGEGAAVDFVKEKDGRMVIWQRVGGPGAFTSGMERPFAEQALRLKAGRLVDATPEFCAQIFTPGHEDFDEWTRVLTPENLTKLQGVKKFGYSNSDLDVVVSALLSRAMQRVLCRQYDEALADLDLWPEGSRDQMKDEFAASVKEFSPEFVERLRAAAK
ncbi:MAG TPA: hypothetical protein VMH04_13545 [Candidatus Solibacter sp.]|nr:hypothetical protein [Candidatus Solibacter sp.]